MTSDPRTMLASIVGDAHVTDAADVLRHHGTDESLHEPRPPEWVVYPANVDDVAAVVRWCAETGTPLVPFGAGTSLEGHVAALRGGVCLDMTRMNTIVEIVVDDLQVVVQPGVTRLQLERALGPRGLFFPVDPGADATLGGMVATGASGTMSVRYGTMRERVVSLTVVTAAGEVMRTRSRARKSSAGYDLTRLFVGSEGTLGVIVECTLWVEPIPEALSAAVCSLPTLDDAVACVVASAQMGVDTARIEMLDEAQVAAINARCKTTLPEAPTLLVECHGSTARVAQEAEAFAELAREHGATEVQWTSDPTRRLALWRARHEAYPAALALRPGAEGIPSDVCVPLSRLAECVAQTRADIAAEGLTAPIVGHIGDGNFHVLYVVDTDNADEMARYRRVNDRLVRRAIEIDGTCTGEHGVGHGKKRYLTIEHDPAALEAMRGLKRVFDPENIMNPGRSSTSSGALQLSSARAAAREDSRALLDEHSANRTRRAPRPEQSWMSTDVKRV